ncbi:MAG: 4Fe-4S dicluster domain-containing protein [Candidatus Zixiibacteriota bacterium]
MEGYPKFFLEFGSMKLLLKTLQKNKYEVVGPTVRDKAIVYEFIDHFEDFPIGIYDDQNNGYYRIKKTNNGTIFSGYTVGQNSVKQFIYPSVKTIFKFLKKNNNYRIDTQENDIPELAFIGLRACELAAIKILDKILIQGAYVDHDYLQFRQKMIVIAVNCSSPGNTCFCESMNTGPVVSEGFDLALTEIDNDSYFVVTVGSEKGHKLLQTLSLSTASDKQLSDEKSTLEKAKSKMSRKLSLGFFGNSLNGQFDNPDWDEIAGRCLTCGNCTMVCPTCFCINFEDETDIQGKTAVRLRKWDSCFNREFSNIHGGCIRQSGKSRYRQWLMHKLSYWNNQFDLSGCVGCGRCITWCPVGIDITEEATRICKNV